MNKKIIKQEVICNYLVNRKRIKSIIIRVNRECQVSVSAPINLKSKIIEEFIISKEGWIKKSIEKIQNKIPLNNESDYLDGDDVYFLGNKYTLKIVKKDNVNTKINISKNNLIVEIGNVNDIKKEIQKWYYEQAKIYIEKYINIYLKKLNENINKLSIKKMNTRWGSCNCKKKYINFNVNLVKKTEKEIEYVVLHELAHLKHPNHSKDFYQYIESYMSNYKEIEKLLKIT